MQTQAATTMAGLASSPSRGSPRACKRAPRKSSKPVYLNLPGSHVTVRPDVRTYARMIPGDKVAPRLLESQRSQ